MFTGIIEKKGTIKRRTPKGALWDLEIAVGEMWDDVRLGESIAVNGVCLTVTHIVPTGFCVDVSKPTIDHTTLGILPIQSPVNLERALQVGERLGGHWVQGHIDGLGSVSRVYREKENLYLQIEAPPPIINYLILKGSVAVDGISLTVQALDEKSFTVVIIPHTVQHTTLYTLQQNSKVNIEGDVLSKYIERHLQGKDKKELTVDFLKKHGFK